jgi:hypothetical protein
MSNVIITEQQIKKAEDLLQERYCIAMQTDENMGNKDGLTFLPNNIDYSYYKGCVDVLICFGLSVERLKRYGKVIHLIY